MEGLKMIRLIASEVHSIRYPVICRKMSESLVTNINDIRFNFHSIHINYSSVYTSTPVT